MSTSPSARRPPWRGLTAFAVLACLAVPLAAAEHPQTNIVGSTAYSARFDHDGDNEWWVEVLTQPIHGDEVVAMEVRSTTTSFRPLQKMGMSEDYWTKWGPSQAFRIPTGDRVQFRAHVMDWGTNQPGTVESCWFTHPAGVEQCTPSWKATLVGPMREFSGGESAIGDPDNDGRRDVLVTPVASFDGDPNLYIYTWTGTAWRTTEIRAAPDQYMSALAVGDADNDGKSEIYTSGNHTIDQTTWTGTSWVTRPIAFIPERVAADLTVGDADGDGRRELYAVTRLAEDQQGAFIGRVLQIKFVAGAWQTTQIATLDDWGTSVWIGDADRDGRLELVAASRDEVAIVEMVAGVWKKTTVNLGGAGDVMVGDADRDGRQEIYFSDYGDRGASNEIYQTSFSNGLWTTKTIPLPEFPSYTTLGDGDGDGKQEIYFTTATSDIYQLVGQGGAWAISTLDTGTQSFQSGGTLVLGDGDNFGGPELYVTGGSGTCSPGDPCFAQVFQISKLGTMPGTFDATFTGVRGNEWWIQANVVASGGTLAKVDVRLNGGEWKPLAKQSWGANAWAASYRAVQGTIVQLRATSTTGATDLSDCYRWIPPSNTDATKVACDNPPPTTFDATFSGVKGNEWWVQANVAGNQPIAKVEARINCGSTWHTLTLQSWGGWAKSFHVPSGSKVDFRATSSTGATDLSAGYIWPQATPTGAC